MTRSLLITAVFMNGGSLWFFWTTLFLQTHWESPRYVAMVTMLVGTPLINLAAIGAVLNHLRSAAKKPSANSLIPSS